MKTIFNLTNRNEEVAVEKQKEESITSGTINEYSVWKELMFLLIKMISIVLVFFLLFTFIFGLLRYEEMAMDPAIRDGDLVIYYRNTKEGYQPGEVVVISINDQNQIRRVIAIEGDIVDITEAGLYINGDLQHETGIFWTTMRYQDGVDFPLTVPQGSVFVLGDNRLNVIDSRMYGCINDTMILGKVMTVIRQRGF